MRRHFRILVSLLDILEAGACIAGLIAICALVSANVLMRYVFASPLGWTHEIIMYTFMISSLIGISTAYRRQRHLQLNGFLVFLPARLRRIIRVCVFFAILGLLLFLLGKSIELNNIYSRLSSPLNGLPRSLLSLGLIWSFTSMSLTTLYFISELLLDEEIQPIIILQKLGIAGDLSVTGELEADSSTGKDEKK